MPVWDARAFRHAQDEANDGIDRRTHSEQRRHGMDFDGDHLDVAYYEGTSLVTLRQPEHAQPILGHSLEVQGQGHIKAHSICTSRWRRPTCINTRSSGRAKSGSRLLTSSDQRIGPIDQRARDLLRELEPWRSSPSVRALAERLATP